MMIMKNKRPGPTPFKILLDLFGAAIALIGMIDYMKIDVPFIPDAIRFQGHGLTLIITGISIMLLSGVLFVLQVNAARKTKHQAGTVDRG